MNRTNRRPPLVVGGPGKMSFPGGIDSRKYPTKTAPIQSQSRKVRLKYLAGRLHALGPKPLFHFLNELERGADLRSHLERYAALPADFIKALGGVVILPPVHLVRGGGR